MRSPDGRHLYVVGQENDVTTLAWDGVAGTLAFVEADANGEGSLAFQYPDYVVS